MKIREVTDIQSPPAEVWPWVATPERFLQWDTNIVSMEVRTRVTKTIRVRTHRVPLWARPPIWFVSRFGKPIEPDRLKRLCEGRPIPTQSEKRAPRAD